MMATKTSIRALKTETNKGPLMRTHHAIKVTISLEPTTPYNTYLIFEIQEIKINLKKKNNKNNKKEYRIRHCKKPDVPPQPPLTPIPLHAKSKNNSLDCSHHTHQSCA
jgi:hypothetical protein